MRRSILGLIIIVAFIVTPFRVHAHVVAPVSEKVAHRLRQKLAHK